MTNKAGMIGFGLVFTVAAIALSSGARLLPSAETGLLSALETPLSPLLAYLVLQEMPTGETMLGGGIILIAIFWAQCRNLRQRTASD